MAHVWRGTWTLLIDTADGKGCIVAPIKGVRLQDICAGEFPTQLGSQQQSLSSTIYSRSPSQQYDFIVRPQWATIYALAQKNRLGMFFARQWTQQNGV
jgi:hypothetical protein